MGVTADKTNLRPNETAQLAVSGQLADGKPITPEMIEDVTYHTDRDDLVSIDAVSYTHLDVYKRQSAVRRPMACLNRSSLS